jgi:hypothetical protein
MTRPSGSDPLSSTRQRFLAARLPDDERLRELREAEERFPDPEERFVSPASARCLFTVAPAISFARLVLRPRFMADSLMCSYWRARFALDPRGGIRVSSGTPVGARTVPSFRCASFSTAISP